MSKARCRRKRERADTLFIFGRGVDFQFFHQIAGQSGVCGLKCVMNGAVAVIINLFYGV